MYLVFRAGGFPAQAALWQLCTTRRLLLHDLTGAEVDRMVELMETYRDRPMDLADASVVAAAEHLGMRRLFALVHLHRSSYVIGPPVVYLGHETPTLYPPLD